MENRRWKTWLATAAIAAALTSGCVAGPTSGRAPTSAPTREPAVSAATPAQAERLQRTMVPLLRVMNRPLSLEQVSVGILDSREINAGNAGGGSFFVTRGLLERANDAHLSAVLAHEIAHEDLNHVGKAQVLAAGLGVGVV